MTEPEIDQLLDGLMPELEDAVRATCREGEVPMIIVPVGGGNGVLVWMGPSAQLDQFRSGYLRALHKVEEKQRI